MEFIGVLQKMITEHLDTVQYYLNFSTDVLHINQLIDREITLEFQSYQCLKCSLNKEIYRQGFCKSCFFETPSAGDWIMRPELSKAHLDIEDRDLDFEKKVQLQPHVVYLANSGNIKVGVTRKSQIPTRWIDQGAHEAIEVVELPNRYLAGITEVALKEHIADRTNWRVMLKNEIMDEDLIKHRDQLLQFIPDEVKKYTIENNSKTNIFFPVKQYPLKPKSLNIQKEKKYTGKVVGIKGQYLIFEDQTVFNIRANEGLVVKFTI